MTALRENLAALDDSSRHNGKCVLNFLPLKNLLRFNQKENTIKLMKTSVRP